MAKQIETEGYCGWCGLFDSHLVDETCPQCQPKITTVGDDADDYDDVPLGVEAADTTLPGNREKSHVHKV